MTYGSAIVADAVAAVSTAGNAATPTTAEAIRAIRAFRPDLREPITQLCCQGFGEDEPTEAASSYRMNGKKPRKDKTYFAVDGNGWHLIDEPACCPAMKQGTN